MLWLRLDLPPIPWKLVKCTEFRPRSLCLFRLDIGAATTVSHSLDMLSFRCVAHMMPCTNFAVCHWHYSGIHGESFFSCAVQARCSYYVSYQFRSMFRSRIRKEKFNKSRSGPRSDGEKISDPSVPSACTTTRNAGTLDPITMGQASLPNP